MPDLWIARDGNGDVYTFQGEPQLSDIEPGVWLGKAPDFIGYSHSWRNYLSANGTKARLVIATEPAGVAVAVTDASIAESSASGS
jgi:hypothetical protein